MSNLSVELECIKFYTIPYITASFMVGSLTIMGNIFVIVAVAKFKRLQTATNVFVVSLSVADLLIGFEFFLISMYNFVRCYATLNGEISQWVVSVYQFSKPLLIPSSILSLLSVSLERYLAITKPFWYVQKVTVRKCVITTSVIWVTTTLLATTKFFSSDKSLGDTETSFKRINESHFWMYGSLSALALLITTGIYYRLWRVILHHRLKIVCSSTVQYNNSSKTQKKESKNAMLIFVILVCFYLSWMPILIVIGVMLTAFDWDIRITPSWFIVCHQIAEVFVHSNSFCNPLIYAWMNSDFKDSFRMMVTCKNLQSNK